MLQELTSGGLLASSGDGHCPRFDGPPRCPHVVFPYVLPSTKREIFIVNCRLSTLSQLQLAVTPGGRWLQCLWRWQGAQGKQPPPFLLCKKISLSEKLLY